MLYEFKLGHNTVEATKNICYTKGEGTVDFDTVYRWFKKFCLGCKNFNDQVRSGRSKTVDSKVREANLGSSIQRVSGEFGISQFSAVKLWLMLPKYCKTFDSLY